MRRGQNLPALTPIDANNVGTPEELFAFLNQLSAIDDGPMGSLMSAHIEALQFVQSPQAINSAIARTLDHVVRAMDAAGTLQERQQAQRTGVHLVNNFVTYIDAKHHADVKNDRAEAERIFQDFAQGVLSGITTVAATAAGGAGLQIANFAQHTGLVARFVELGFRFFSNRRNQAERKEAFIQSVEGVIRTLEIYSSQLGSSNIVASLVTSYTPLIVQHRESINKTKIGEKEKKAKRAGHQFFMSLIATFVSALVLKAFTGLVGGVSKAVVAILRWIKLIGPDAADKATGFPVMWVIWIAVFVVNGYMLARWLRRIRECRDEHTRQEQHITQLRAEIAEVTNRFRE